MKKSKREIWISQIKTLTHSLRFSSLDEESKSCINNEQFYFNNSRAPVFSWMIMILEALNVVHVLFFSKSGLSTQNNRQYFVMYLLLFASGAICLVIRRQLHHKPKLLGKCYIGLTCFWLFWHAALSALDLRQNPNITVFIAGIFGLSLLVRLKPKEAFTILPCSLLILLFFARDSITIGIAINAIIITLMAILISCSRYFSTLEELGYRQKMIIQANHRTEEKQTLEFLCRQQQALLQHSRELLFLWDKKADTLIFSENRTLCSADRDEVRNWLAKCNYKHKGLVTLRLENETSPTDCQIECTPLLDSNNILSGAAGRIDCPSSLPTQKTPENTSL